MIELPFVRIRIQIRETLWAILFMTIGSFFLNLTLETFGMYLAESNACACCWSLGALSSEQHACNLCSRRYMTAFLAWCNCLIESPFCNVKQIVFFF